MWVLSKTKKYKYNFSNVVVAVVNCEELYKQNEVHTFCGSQQCATNIQNGVSFVACIIVKQI